MNWRAILFVPAVALGIAFFIYQSRDTDPNVAAEIEQAPVPVRTQTIDPEPLSVAISGYGRVDAITTWQAVSQVSGRVVDLAPDFAIGSILDADVPAVVIDPRDYEIALAKAEANLATARADLDVLAAEEANAIAELALEEQVETFLQAEYDRRAQLVESGASTQAALELANRELLNQQRIVLDLRSEVALYPVQRISTRSTIETREVEVEEAERDLAFTRIVTPFRGRISDTNLSIGEFVSTGETLLDLNDISAAEINASFQPADLTRVLRAVVPSGGFEIIEAGNGGESIRFLETLGFKVSVRQIVGDTEHRWPATLVRFSGTADTSTGAVDLVVKVDNPTVPDVETERPPLNTDSFVEVVLTRPGMEDVITVPRAALHYTGEGAPYVYTVAADDRLDRSDIVVQTIVADQALIAAGLAAGDVVVLSDPQPAILGMALAPVPQD